MTPTRLLDVRGLRCPLPILRAARALKDVPAGGTLRVLATDPLAVDDFADFCRSTGNVLVESTRDGDAFSFLIRRAAPTESPG
jgi:tRNA 2-thiouridine synthesizing protein A